MGRGRRCANGAPGTDDGFAYRILYIDPGLVQAALGGGLLPFVSSPVVDLTDQQKNALSAAWEMKSPIDDIGRIEITAAAADFLRASSGAPRPLRKLDLPGLLRVRSLMHCQGVAACCCAWSWRCPEVLQIRARSSTAPCCEACRI